MIFFFLLWHSSHTYYIDDEPGHEKRLKNLTVSYLKKKNSRKLELYTYRDSIKKKCIVKKCYRLLDATFEGNFLIGSEQTSSWLVCLCIEIASQCLIRLYACGKDDTGRALDETRSHFPSLYDDTPKKRKKFLVEWQYSRIFHDDIRIRKMVKKKSFKLSQIFLYVSVYWFTSFLVTIWIRQREIRYIKYCRIKKEKKKESPWRLDGSIFKDQIPNTSLPFPMYERSSPIFYIECFWINIRYFIKYLKKKKNILIIQHIHIHFINILVFFSHLFFEYCNHEYWELPAYVMAIEFLMNVQLTLW